MKSRKRFILVLSVLLAAGVGASAFLWRYLHTTVSYPAATAGDVLKFNLARKSNLVEVFHRVAVPSVVLDRVDPSRRIRLAVGWLGLPDEEQNRRVGDLVVAGLSSDANLELVDRQSSRCRVARSCVGSIRSGPRRKRRAGGEIIAGRLVSFGDFGQHQRAISTFWPAWWTPAPGRCAT